ncbi:M23 family metallopeptidase [Cellulosimicrobium cellulans]|uniref:M23 family metallopeptidase n=1 Tax=Cellulosimicrobium cellulans TaxID=1710 RepID=UPI002404918C|nr:M23 family metallopeptidase [Cellulosimicrobium cellulans]MDF9878083.1 murein DD-endopeptidase MepM/ murein hydrolase activator NlpD [Cellulosimicrobium cellulans]
MALDRAPATTRPRAVALVLSAFLLVLAPAASATTGGSGEVPSAASPGWVPPLDRALETLGVLAPFDPPLQDWLPGHRGVDLAAAAGEPVLAPAPGVVTFAGPVAGRDVVVVTHDDGLRTSLEPVTSSAPRGTRVAAGDVVGTVQGSDGAAVASHCAATCVHWGVRRGERYVDPLALLGERPPIVLLPLGAP